MSKHPRKRIEPELEIIIKAEQEKVIKFWLDELNKTRDFSQKRNVIAKLISWAKENDEIDVVREVIRRADIAYEVETMRLRKMINPNKVPRIGKRERYVLNKMSQGWELGVAFVPTPAIAWIQEEGVGRGGKSEIIPYSVFDRLAEKNLIKLDRGKGSDTVWVINTEYEKNPTSSSKYIPESIKRKIEHDLFDVSEECRRRMWEKGMVI